MEFSLDCYPCAMRQTLRLVRQAGMSEEKQRVVMRRILQELLEFEPGADATDVISPVHALIRELTGIDDLYKEEKEEATKEALALYPQLKEMVENSPDPFETAVRLSVAGNIIDYGALDGFDLQKTIRRVLEQPFALDDMEALRSAIEQAEQILFLADNAGETVFDRVLIETMDKPVVYVCKGGPIINDATIEDARAAGLDKVSEVISCGAACAGTVLPQCSAEFIKRYNAAELIIAKGMGNYETLCNEKTPIFFLLQVKCDLVARDLAVRKGSIVCAKNPNTK